MANATEYRFTRLKIVGNTTAITVTGIHIYIKTTGTAGIGIEDLAQSGGWNLISVNAPISTLPATLPATPLNGTSLTLNAPTHAALLSATDIITIGFDNIQ